MTWPLLYSSAKSFVSVPIFEELLFRGVLQGGMLGFRESVAIVGFAGANESASDAGAAAAAWGYYGVARTARSSKAVHLVATVPCAALPNLRVRPPTLAQPARALEIRYVNMK